MYCTHVLQVPVLLAFVIQSITHTHTYRRLRELCNGMKYRLIEYGTDRNHKLTTTVIIRHRPHSNIHTARRGRLRYHTLFSLVSTHFPPASSNASIVSTHFPLAWRVMSSSKVPCIPFVQLPICIRYKLSKQNFNKNMGDKTDESC